MNKIKVAKELVKLAKNLIALDDNVKTKKINFLDFIKKDIDVDMYADGIGWMAFCGPCQFTEKGKKKFAPLFDKEVQYTDEFAKMFELTDNEEKLLSIFLVECAGHGAHNDEWFTDYEHNKQEALDILIKSQGSEVLTLASNMRLVIQRKILDENTISYLKKHLPYKGDDVSDALKKSLEVYFDKYLFNKAKCNIYVDEFLSDSERDWLKKELTKTALANLKANQEEIEEQLYHQLRSSRII